MRLSVVLATDRLATVLDAVVQWRAQTVASELELVLVGPGGLDLPQAERGGFGAVRVVELGSVTPLAAARAAGVRAASAPLVVVGETHALPRPDMAEALLAAHEREGWAGVVPAFANGNPDGPISWSNLILTYGRWSVGAPGGEIDEIPTYNSCFRRELLVSYGERLAPLLEPGSELVADLRAQGHRVAFEPSAQLEHLNVSRPSAWIVERYLGGRVIAMTRSRRWSSRRRLAHVLGSPLIPAVFLFRALSGPGWRARPPDLPRLTLPALVVGILAWGAGEAVGYAVGPGDAEPRLAEFELHRARYV